MEYQCLCSTIAAVVSAGVAVAEFVLHYLDRKRREEAVDADRCQDAQEAAMEDETTTPRDLTRYSINGVGSYEKNRLVLEVIRQYVNQNSQITYEELQAAFPKSVRGVKKDNTFWGCFNYQKDAEKLYRETGYRRHFLDKKEIINLRNDDAIAVSTQWGRSNIELFIDCARKLGFAIERITER